MHRPPVAVIVLNHHRLQDTCECLASLSADIYPRKSVILLDSGSEERELGALREAFPWVQIIRLPQNRGYAGNNNVGIRAALANGAEWVFLLNEDTVVDPHCLSRLVENADAGTGILGPLVLRKEAPDKIESGGGVLNSRWESVHIARDELDLGQRLQPRAVDFATGCAMLLRRQVLEQIGLFDERFFMYWEETDLCLRARKAGWKVLNVPEARIRHKGQAGVLPNPRVVYYMTRNRLLLMAKHHAPLRAWAFVAVQMAGSVLASFHRHSAGSARDYRTAVIRGILDFLKTRDR